MAHRVVLPSSLFFFLLVISSFVADVAGQQWPRGPYMLAEESCYPPFCASLRLFKNNLPYNKFAQLALPVNPGVYSSAEATTDDLSITFTRQKGAAGSSFAQGEGPAVADLEREQDPEEVEQLRRICRNLGVSASEEMRLSCRRFEEKKKGDQEEKEASAERGLGDEDVPKGNWDSEVWKMTTKILKRNRKTEKLWQARDTLKRQHQNFVSREEAERQEQQEEARTKKQEGEVRKTSEVHKSSRHSLLMNPDELDSDIAGVEERCVGCTSQSSSPSPSPSSSITASPSASSSQSSSQSKSPSASISASTSPSPSQSPLYPIEFLDPGSLDNLQTPIGSQEFFPVETDRSDRLVELLSVGWTTSQGLSLPFGSVAGAYFRGDKQNKKSSAFPAGLFGSLEGTPTSFPLSITKNIDKTSPLWMQATTDFDPFGRSWTYGGNSMGNATRTCPRLFQLLILLPLDSASVGKPATRLLLSVVDAIPVNIKISVSAGGDPVETIDFMWRAMLGSLVTENLEPLGPNFENNRGFGVGGIAPVPIPGAPTNAPYGTDCCGSMIPWANVPGVEPPYCDYFDITAF